MHNMNTCGNHCLPAEHVRYNTDVLAKVNWSSSDLNKNKWFQFVMRGSPPLDYIGIANSCHKTN